MVKRQLLLLHFMCALLFHPFIWNYGSQLIMHIKSRRGKCANDALKGSDASPWLRAISMTRMILLSCLLSQPILVLFFFYVLFYNLVGALSSDALILFPQILFLILHSAWPPFCPPLVDLFGLIMVETPSIPTFSLCALHFQNLTERVQKSCFWELINVGWWDTWKLDLLLSHCENRFFLLLGSLY